MNDFDIIINECQNYIKSKQDKNNKTPFDVQYIELAIEVRNKLIDLKEKKSIPFLDHYI